MGCLHPCTGDKDQAEGIHINKVCWEPQRDPQNTEAYPGTHVTIRYPCNAENHKGTFINTTGSSHTSTKAHNNSENHDQQG